MQTQKAPTSVQAIAGAKNQHNFFSINFSNDKDMDLFNMSRHNHEKKPRRNQILRIMRITSYLLFFCSIFMFAENSHSQNARVTINQRNVRLVTVLDEIEKQTDYLFLYEGNQINMSEKVSVNVKNMPVNQLLNKLFSDSQVHYAMEGTHIVLLSKNYETPSDMVPQQQITVTGTVTDKGGPLPGANVLVKGTTIGASTGVDGRYSITVPSENAVLQFTYIGYNLQEVIVGTQKTIDINLIEDTRLIEEVVIVGYGSIKREAVTGAVARANLDVYKDVPSNNILDRIKGSVAGLNISGTNRSGAIGDLLIRGQNSPTAGNAPLIVVDGVIFAGSLADVSTYDIENLTVLKDASAAAVYGSRSANGVILIETKRGQGINGKPVFNLDLNYGFSNQMEPLKVYDADGYLKRLLEIREMNGLEADPSRIEVYLGPIEREQYLATPDHKPTIQDPYSLLRQAGYNRNINFSVANRMEKTRYYIATSVIDQRGVEVNDQFKQLAVRINIDSDITHWLNIGIKSFYSYRDISGTPPPDAKSQMSPWANLYNPDGTYTRLIQSLTAIINPYWLMATDDVKQRNTLNGIVTATVKAPWVKGLTYTTTLSNTLRWENDNQFWNKYTTTGESRNGYGYRYARNYNNLLWDNLVKFNRTFLDKHAVDVTMLFSQEKYSYERVYATAQDFDDMSLGTYRLQAGKTQTVETGGEESAAVGLMARANYTYNNKYSITGTIRRDGYSAFSKNKKYGTFPSIGVNWNISRESFMENISYLDNLSVRATYGSNGNQSIGLYQTLARISNDRYMLDNTSVITQYISSLANDDLGWETTTGLNVGVDFGWLNERINGSVDIYRTSTYDLLYSLSLPRITGMGSITSNVGEIQNRGIEISLNTLNMDRADFKWYSNFAFSLNRNKVVSITGEKDADGKEADLISSGYFMGKSLGVIYNYNVIGMYQQKDADNGTIMTGYLPGDYIYEDIDGDGQITSDKDRKILGNTKENFRWSWTNSFHYKGLSLMLYLYSIWGGNGWYLSTANTPNLDINVGFTEINHPVYDYWTTTHTDAFFPRPAGTRTPPVNAYKPIDRSFIKLQKISLTYDVGQWIKSLNFNNLTVGVSADNLFTFAPHWMGLDPETNQGLTWDAVPSIRTYNCSISVNF